MCLGPYPMRSIASVPGRSTFGPFWTRGELGIRIVDDGRAVDRHGKRTAERGIVLGRRQVVVDTTIGHDDCDFRGPCLLCERQQCERAGCGGRSVVHDRVGNEAGVAARSGELQLLAFPGACRNLRKIDNVRRSVPGEGYRIDLAKGRWRVVKAVTEIEIDNILVPVELDHMGAGLSRRRYRAEEVEPAAGHGDPVECRGGVGVLEDDFFDPHWREGWILCQDQGCCAGDMGRCHGGAAVAGVTTARHRAVDVRPGCAQVDRSGSVVGKVRHGIVVVGRGDRDNVVQVVACRIARRGVVVAAVVPRCCHKQAPGAAGGSNRIVHGRVVPSPAPTVVGDAGAHHGGIFDCQEGVVRRSAPIVIEELEGHELGIPVDARHSGAVISLRCNRARAVRAVTIAVHRIAVAVGEVVAVDIVHIAVGIVVNAVAGDLARVGPDVVHQIGVRVVDPGVDYADEDVGAGLDIPRFRRIDIGIGGSAALAGVVEPPEVGKVGVVGDCRIDRKGVVRLDIFNPRVVTPGGNRVGDACVDVPEFHAERAGGAECGSTASRLERAESVKAASGRRFFEFDDHLIGHKRGIG